MALTNWPGGQLAKITNFEHLSSLISKCDSHVPLMIVIKLANHKTMEAKRKNKTHFFKCAIYMDLQLSAAHNQLIPTWFAN